MSYSRYFWLALAFILPNLAHADAGADAKTEACRRVMATMVDVTKVQVAKTVPALSIPVNPLILDQFPHLVPLSGKFVLRESLRKGTAIRGLFTCSQCGSENQLHNPAELKGGSNCTKCGEDKGPEDGRFYGFPRDEHGKEMEGYIDLTQIVVKPNAKAIYAKKWVCDLCTRDVTDGDMFCPSCNGYHDANPKELSDAAGELEKIAREQKLNQTEEGRAYLKGENMAKAVQDFLKNSRDKLGEMMNQAKRAAHAAPAFVKEHVRTIAAITGVSLGTAWLLYMYFDTNEFTTEIIETQWSHEISFEVLTTLKNQQNWCDDLPAGARNIQIIEKNRRYSRNIAPYSPLELWARVSLRKVERLSLVSSAWAEKGLIDHDNGYFSVDEDEPTPSKSKPKAQPKSQPRSQPKSSQPRKNSPSGSSSSSRSSKPKSTAPRGGYDSEDDYSWGSDDEGEDDYTPPPPPEPVYKDYCSYEIDRWVHSRTVSDGDKNPSSESEMTWPAAEPGERESRRSATYRWKMRYKDTDGKVKPLEKTFRTPAEFLSRPAGSTGIQRVNHFGTAVGDLK